MNKTKKENYYKEWYIKNREKRLIYNKRYGKDNKDKIKEWRKLNHDILLEKDRERRISNGWIPKVDFLYNKNICIKCKKENVPLVKTSKTKNRQYFLCRECNTLKSKKYRMTVSGKDKAYKSSYKSQKIHKLETRARQLVRYYLNKGEIIKPNICSVCSLNKKIYAHHHDYTKPLEVKWLCRSCHADIHRKLAQNVLK